MEADILKLILQGVLPPSTDEIPRIAINRPQVDIKLQAIRVDDSLINYVTGIVNQTRQHPRRH